MPVANQDEEVRPSELEGKESESLVEDPDAEADAKNLDEPNKAEAPNRRMSFSKI